MMMSGHERGLQMKVRMIVKGETSSSFVMLTAVPANQSRVFGLGEGQIAFFEL